MWVEGALSGRKNRPCPPVHGMNTSMHTGTLLPCLTVGRTRRRVKNREQHTVIQTDRQTDIETWTCTRHTDRARKPSLMGPSLRQWVSERVREQDRSAVHERREGSQAGQEPKLFGVCLVLSSTNSCLNQNSHHTHSPLSPHSHPLSPHSHAHSCKTDTASHPAIQPPPVGITTARLTNEQCAP